MGQGFSAEENPRRRQGPASARLRWRTGRDLGKVKLGLQGVIAWLDPSGTSVESCSCSKWRTREEGEKGAGYTAGLGGSVLAGLMGIL